MMAACNSGATEVPDSPGIPRCKPGSGARWTWRIRTIRGRVAPWLRRCTTRSQRPTARRRVHHDAHGHRPRPSIIGGDAHRSGERRHATRVMAR